MAQQKIDVLATGTFFHVLKLTEGDEALFVVKDSEAFSEVFDTQDEAEAYFTHIEQLVAYRIAARS